MVVLPWFSHWHNLLERCEEDCHNFWGEVAGTVVPRLPHCP